MRKKVKNDIKRAIKDTIPVLSGYLVLGMGFGVLMQSKGYGFLLALAMSIFIYAGSMQYLAIDLLSGGASLITAALTTLMVNARHLFYGISMVDRYKNAKKKPYIIFALTDETYSLVCSVNEENEEKRNRYYFLVSLFNQIYWVVGSALGVLLGEVIPFSTEGIDFALTALFVTVFVEQWKSTKDHIPAMIGVISSVICLALFGAKDFLIPAMILITLMLLALKLFKKEEKCDE
ncbi:MAG: AzlC family ABC transporter permease [Clostridia bacterium]|nr:AzlC family ABC transporter permease [Clostridia bacterium]MBQ6614604.1 AzlC family ABC transporter permease [Clostridia bacterium]